MIQSPLDVTDSNWNRNILEETNQIKFELIYLHNTGVKDYMKSGKFWVH